MDGKIVIQTDRFLVKKTRFLFLILPDRIKEPAFYSQIFSIIFMRSSESHRCPLIFFCDPASYFFLFNEC